MTQDQAYTLGATVVTIGTLGASLFPTKIIPPPTAISFQMKLLGAAGSTVQVLPDHVSGQTIGGATAAVAGWPLPAVGTETALMYGPASFWLAATGATATVAFLWRLTGVSLV